MTNQSGFKQEDERILKTETPERLPSSLAIGDTTKKEADISSDIKKEPEHELKVHYSSESPVKPESQIIEPQCEKIDTKNNILNTRTPSRKDSSDREAMSSPISTAPKNSVSRKSVLKELKNIPETDEATAVDIAMRSDDEYGDDSDDRWTERPPKSKKSRLIKESKKRAKSPTNKGGGSTSKKRRYIDSTKNRRTMRGMKYYDGNSSDDRNYPQHGGVNDMQDLRQCFGHKCLKPTRANSNYCSDECGINLASHRIVQTLPDRLREWNLTECAADIRNKKELEKIRSDQDAVKSRLEQLNIDFRNLEVI